MNEQIIQYLKEMLKISRAEKQPFKVKAYTNAIRSIENLEYDLTSGEEAKKIKGIGKGIGRGRGRGKGRDCCYLFLKLFKLVHQVDKKNGVANGI